MTAQSAAAHSKALSSIDPAWAWTRYEAGGDRPFDLSLAAHLHRRAGFGATWSELEASVASGPEAAIDKLLSGGEGQEEFYRGAREVAGPLLASDNRLNLPAWWLRVMLTTPHPLLEKTTLFWHGHFATSSAKVEQQRLMLDQNELMRRHALGKFGPLLDGMSKDPAMLIWLDSAVNKKTHPNENFAREVMELFSMGLGQYTEHDIKEAARAFTGFEIKDGQFRFNSYHHDPGAKVVLGQAGAWKGDDVIRILLDHEATANFIVGKMFRFFVSERETPPAALLAPLAKGWREHDYDSSWLIRTILSSNLFFSPAAVRGKFKTPVEFALGIVRSLEGKANTYAVADDLEELGQLPFYPPNVKGWNGAKEWINSSTLVARANAAWALVGGRDDRHRERIPLDKLAALQGLSEPAAIVRRFADLLLGGPLPDAVQVQLTSLAASQGDRRQRLAQVVHGIATLPEFQLA